MKNIFKYLAIFIAIASLSVCAASAAPLETYDFGDFTALSPAGVQYTQDQTELYHYYYNQQAGIAYVYIGSSLVNDATIGIAYQALESMGFEKIGSDGNLTVYQINNGDIGRYAQYGVETHVDGKIVCIAGNDLNELKEIGSSVRFK